MDLIEVLQYNFLDIFGQVVAGLVVLHHSRADDWHSRQEVEGWFFKIYCGRGV